MSSASQVTGTIIRRFEQTAAARDCAIGEGRQVIRLAANSIRATHRGDLAGAAELLAEADKRLSAMVATIRAHPSVYWAGYTQDAMKEVAEAAITRALVAGEPLPGPETLAIEDAAWLNGLAEAASELRREVLDQLRAGHLDRASALLDAMDDVYSALITVDFPDAITGGLRRTTDQLRGVLERTRGDVTIAVTQGRVEAALRQALGSERGEWSWPIANQDEGSAGAGNPETGVPAP